MFGHGAVFFSLLIVCNQVELSRAVEGALCSKKTVPYLLQNSPNGAISLFCKAWDCVTERQELEMCSKTPEKACTTHQWIGGISRENSQDDYKVYCCNYTAADESTSTKINASLTPGGSWEATLINDNKGRRYTTIPYIIERIGKSTTYNVALRQIRCRPPPPPNNQVQQIPDRGSFTKFDVQTKDDKGIDQTIPVAYGTCFSGDNVVNTPGGKKSMAELRQGDLVLSVGHGGLVAYRRVYFMLHRNPSLVADFVVLSTASGQLTLSANHLVYRFDCDTFAIWQFNYANANQLTFAGNMRVGDCVAVRVHGVLELQPIVTVNKVRNRGIYSPVTENGVIIVNDVVASCYSYTNDVNLAESWYSSVVGSLQTLLQWLPVGVRRLVYEPYHWDFVDLQPVTKFLLTHVDALSP